MDDDLPQTLFGARVERGPVETAVAEPIIDSESALHGLVADADHAIFRVAGIASFGIDRGERVSVQLEPGAAPGRAAEYLTSTVATLVLGQQRRFALHANAVSIDGTGVLFAGHRGAGKSTTSLRLIQRGHTHLTDDVCLLEAAGDQLVLDPPARGIRFLAHTAQALDLDVRTAHPSRAADDKRVLPQPAAAAGPVRAIVCLERARVEAVQVRRLAAREAVELVTEHAYRRLIVQRLWPRELFAWTADLVERIPVHLLRRPDSGWTVDQVADAVESVARSASAR